MPDRIAAALLAGSFLAQPALAQGTDARTAAIVEAADAFLATLGEDGQDAALFDWADEAQRANWSNLPIDMVPRGGVAWGDMDAAQRDALMALLGTVLSEHGLVTVREQMAADDVLAAEAAAGTGGGPDLTFGSAYYYVSLLGEPSETEPWMLQFGGHHLAINATVVGPDVTLSPTLTGGQPLAFTLDGTAIYIVGEEVGAAQAMVSGLSAEQVGQMVRGEGRIDLVLGPGQDGRTLQREGLRGADMTDAQRAQFLALIEARLGLLNEDDLAALMGPVAAGLDETALAWFGPTDDPSRSYWRIVGPTLLIEFSPQDLGGDPTQHAHNMYRDPSNEYGAAWAPR